MLSGCTLAYGGGVMVGAPASPLCPSPIAHHERSGAAQYRSGEVDPYCFSVVGDQHTPARGGGYPLAPRPIGGVSEGPHYSV